MTMVLEQENRTAYQATTSRFDSLIRTAPNLIRVGMAFGNNKWKRDRHNPHNLTFADLNGFEQPLNLTTVALQNMATPHPLCQLLHVD